MGINSLKLMNFHFTNTDFTNLFSARYKIRNVNTFHILVFDPYKINA